MCGQKTCGNSKSKGQYHSRCDLKHAHLHVGSGSPDQEVFCNQHLIRIEMRLEQILTAKPMMSLVDLCEKDYIAKRTSVCFRWEVRPVELFALLLSCNNCLSGRPGSSSFQIPLRLRSALYSPRGLTCPSQSSGQEHSAYTASSDEMWPNVRPHPARSARFLPSDTCSQFAIRPANHILFTNAALNVKDATSASDGNRPR